MVRSHSAQATAHSSFARSSSCCCSAFPVSAILGTATGRVCAIFAGSTEHRFQLSRILTNDVQGSSSRFRAAAKNCLSSGLNMLEFPLHRGELRADFQVPRFVSRHKSCANAISSYTCTCSFRYIDQFMDAHTERAIPRGGSVVRWCSSLVRGLHALLVPWHGKAA